MTSVKELQKLINECDQLRYEMVYGSRRGSPELARRLDAKARALERLSDRVAAVLKETRALIQEARTRTGKAES